MKQAVIKGKEIFESGKKMGIDGALLVVIVRRRRCFFVSWYFLYIKSVNKV